MYSETYMSWPNVMTSSFLKVEEGRWEDKKDIRRTWPNATEFEDRGKGSWDKKSVQPLEATKARKPEGLFLRASREEFNLPIPSP